MGGATEIIEEGGGSVRLTLPAVDFQVALLTRLGLTKSKVRDAEWKLHELAQHLKQAEITNCLIVPNQPSNIIVSEMMKLGIIKWEREYELHDTLIAHIESVPFIALQDVRIGGSGKVWGQYKNGHPGMATGHKCILSAYHTPDKDLWCSPGTKGGGGLPLLKSGKAGLSLMPCFSANDSHESVGYLTYGKRRFIKDEKDPRSQRTSRILV